MTNLNPLSNSNDKTGSFNSPFITLSAYSDGAIFVGFIPGKYEEKELVSQHYFDSMYDNLDDYNNGIASQQHIWAREITHPVKPVIDSNKKIESYEFNRITGHNVWIHQIFYDPHFPCRRSNCPWESRGLSKDLDDKLRQMTLDYLKRLRTLAQISFYNMMLMLMNSNIYDNYNYKSAASLKELEEENEFLDAMLSSSPSSAKAKSENSERR